MTKDESGWQLVVWDAFGERELLFPVMRFPEPVLVAGETWVSRFPEDIVMMVEVGGESWVTT